MKALIRRMFRATGLDVVRLPYPHSFEKHLQSLLRRLDVDCVFDIGANRGQFASTLRRIGFNGWILSFEPIPPLVDTLRQRSASDVRWRVLPYAIGNHDGTLTLHVPSKHSPLASALKLNEFARTTFRVEGLTHADEIEVPVYRLDTICGDLMKEHGIRRPFLKLDTQGFDLQALEGARGVLPLLVGLQTEVSLQPLYEGMPDITESLDTIRSMGFDVTGIFPVVYDPRGALIEMDCLAQRRDA